MQIAWKSRRRAAVIVVVLACTVQACSQLRPQSAAPGASSPDPEVGLAPPVSAAALAGDLDRAQDAATKIADPIVRKDALLEVLSRKQKFVADFKGADADAAETMRNGLPDLACLIGDTIATAIKNEKDPSAVAALRSAGVAAFEDVEKAIRNRIVELKAIEKRTADDDNRLMGARYNCIRTLSFHSLLFPAGSKERTDSCNAALAECVKFDLNYGGVDDAPSILAYYAYVDCGLCLKETEAPDEAIKAFERTIALRESWGPKDESGVWPIPAGTGDVTDLVCYATLQKMLVLRDAKKPADVVETGRDYFASTPRPFSAPSSMALAQGLGNAQLATGDAKGAAATAESMIRADPDGVGGVWGRALLGSAGK